MSDARLNCINAKHVSQGVGSQIQETEHYECEAKKIPITEPIFGSLFIKVPYKKGVPRRLVFSEFLSTKLTFQFMYKYIRALVVHYSNRRSQKHEEEV